MKNVNTENGSAKLRRKAEAQLAATEANTEDMENKRILHELQVHQIELEMQNHELRQSQLELESARSRYLDLYDLAPVGYVTLSKDGLIQESNLTFATMLDIPRANLINKPLSTFILPGDQDAWFRFCTQLPETTSSKSCEIRLHKNKNGAFCSRMEVAIANNPDGLLAYHVVVSNINERKRMNDIHLSRSHLMQFAVTHTLEEILVETLNQLETLTDSSIGFYHFFDAKTQFFTLTAWSTRTSKEFCRAEGTGSHYPLESAGVWADCVRQGKPVVHNNLMALPGRKGFPAGHASVTRELIVPVTRGGQIVAVLGVGNKPGEYSQEDTGTVSLLADLTFDITERKLAHNELEKRVAERTAELNKSLEQRKMVSVALFQAEERERERIAAELHDRVGQSLLLAKMKLDELTDRSTGLCRSSAEEVTALLQASIHDIRTLTFRIRPPILDTAGIDTSLKWLCSSLSDDYPIQIEYLGDRHSKPLSADLRYSLYQVVRELLLNVVKHAHTEKAFLSITTGNDDLVIVVEDKGAGFNHSDADLKNIYTGGYGLYNINLRVEQMCGSFSITSSLGKGTSAKITVPLSVC